MKTALFLMVPHLSHYYPTFGLAHLLQAQGYSVVYSGTAGYQSAVEQEGFLFKPVNYVEEILIRKPSVALGLWIKTRLDPSFTKVRYRNFIASIQTIERLMAEVKPDVVCLDDTLGHYYACIAGKARLVQLSTKLSPRQRPSVPPLNFFYVPKDHPVNLLITHLQWWWHIRRRRMNERLQTIVFNGRSDIDFLRRYERRKGIVWQTVRNENVAFYDAVAGLPTLVLAPESLEFRGARVLADEYYLYTPSQRSERDYLSVEYAQYIDRITHRKQVNKTKMIYVALGTLSLAHAGQAYRLLLSIIKAIGGDQTLDVLIATGGLDLSVHTLPSNIFCLPVVPQLDVLNYCDLMITHGGLGSVKECVAAGVPMLVYPLNTGVDQPGNSARIVSLGLGLRGKVSESPASIHRKVYTILNTSLYKKNCRLMQQRLVEDGQQVEAILKQVGLWTQDLIGSYKLMFHV